MVTSILLPIFLEIERYEQTLSNFRGSANLTRKDGLAETEERALKLGEIEKTREMFHKGMLTTITYVDGKKLRNRGKVGLKELIYRLRITI